MKKIITLFASVLLVASAFAQYDNQKGYGKRNDRDVVYNDRKYNKNDRRGGDGYSFSKRERDFEIDRINRDYNNKINAVRHRWFASNAKKQRIIWSLEEQRRDEIKSIYMRFNHPRNRYDDHDRRRNW